MPHAVQVVSNTSFSLASSNSTLSVAVIFWGALIGGGGRSPPFDMFAPPAPTPPSLTPPTPLALPPPMTEPLAAEALRPPLGPPTADDDEETCEEQSFPPGAVRRSNCIFSILAARLMKIYRLILIKELMKETNKHTTNIKNF
jgi:hypothetical protein